MRGMGAVQEIFQAPPPGSYPVAVVDAQAGVSQKGNSQITVTLEIIEGKFKGEQILDWVGTDPSAKGAGIGRGKLRVLLQGTQFNGLADAAETAEVPDQIIAQSLVGQRLFVTIDNSPRKRKDDDGKRTNENMTQLDPATGSLITVMNADVKGYTRHAITAAQVQGQSFTTQAPAQAHAQTATTGYAQQGQPTFAAPPAQAGAPNLAFAPNYAPGAATPPWAGQNGAQPGAEQAPAQRKRKLNVQDVQQG